MQSTSTADDGAQSSAMEDATFGVKRKEETLALLADSNARLSGDKETVIRVVASSQTHLIALPNNFETLASVFEDSNMGDWLAQELKNIALNEFITDVARSNLAVKLKLRS